MNHPPKQARRYRVVTFSADGRRVFLVNGDATVWVCDAMTGERVIPPLHTFAGISDVWLAPNGRRLATAGEDDSLQIWDVDTGESIARIPGVKAKTEWPLFSPDGRLLFAAGRDGVARLWDAHTTEVVAVLEPADSSYDGAFSPDGRYLVTTGKDNRIKIRDAGDGGVLWTLPESLSSICCLQFSIDGSRLLASGIKEQKIVTLVWEIDRRQASTALKAATPVRRANFSPNGRRVVTIANTIADENTARIWDATTGEPVAQPLKHAGSVIHAAFSPDGSYIVTASQDQTVRVWDASLGEPLTPSLWHPTSLVSASFSLDGRFVLAIDERGSARVWDLAGDRLPPEEDITRIVQLLGQSRIDANTGVLVPLGAADYREKWQALSPKVTGQIPANASQESAWHWWQAEDSAEVGQWSAVLWHLSHLKEPASSTIWARRGDAHRNLSEFDKAIADYEMAAKLLPVDPALPWDRANLWRQRGDVLLKSSIPSSSARESIVMWPAWWAEARRVTRFLGTGPVGTMADHLMGSIKLQPVRRISPLDVKKANDVRASISKVPRTARNASKLASSHARRQSQALVLLFSIGSGMLGLGAGTNMGRLVTHCEIQTRKRPWRRSQGEALARS